MRLFRSVRWLLLALLLPLIPASQARAGVFISVGFAPPVLPVYVQPQCPEAGYMWTPGYWGYGDDGYYWVPGAWVPAPYYGALWTPPYWGWQGGLYVFHTGYWGPHVGYYGGVNYGFGYMGIGFVGGAWHGREFAYNTAVMHVNERVIHNTYIDRTVVEHNTVIRDSRVAYSGGPGGINHAPTAEERTFTHEQHTAPTGVQQAHIQAARSDHSNYFNANHGQPQHAAFERPMTSAGVNTHASAGVQGRPGGFNANANANSRTQYRPAQPQSQPRLSQQQNGYRPNGQGSNRPQPQTQYRPQQQPQSHAQQQTQYRPQQQPQSHAPQQEPRPQTQQRPQSRPQSKPDPREGSHPGGPKGR
ncbi:MAG TPA: YXWGXW repeat-containing protein [Terracidiphilus sp.]|jgi:hypothetical protein|nr:YXWGXW repeat-containing protein [Terracidiphilus sp.]